MPKVVLLGQQFVGKTTLLNKLLNKELGSYRTTMGADFVAHPDKPDLNLWDTCSFDRLQTLDVYDELMRTADVSLYCVDLSTCEKTQTITTELTQLKHKFPNTTIILVGTKVDLASAVHNPRQPNKKELLNEIAAELQLDQYDTSDDSIKALNARLLALSSPRTTLNSTIHLADKAETHPEVTKPKPKRSWRHVLGTALAILAIGVFIIVLWLGIFFPPTLPGLTLFLPFLAFYSSVTASAIAASIFSGILLLGAAILKIKDCLSSRTDHSPKNEGSTHPYSSGIRSIFDNLGGPKNISPESLVAPGTGVQELFSTNHHSRELGGGSTPQDIMIKLDY